MTPIEAYELTLQRLDELKKEGIDVQIKPCKSRDDKELVDKYSKKPGTIPPEKWVNVDIKINGKADMDKVFKVQDELMKLGISFDTGFDFGSKTRDWELDWSFSYKNKTNESVRGYNEWKSRNNLI